MLDTVRWQTRDGRMLEGPAGAGSALPGMLRVIDQTRLPHALTYLCTDTLEVIEDAIRRLVVRGAPAIGCAAALGLAAVLQHENSSSPAVFLEAAQRVAERLAATRPTAVNLTWALRRCRQALEAAVLAGAGARALPAVCLREALSILAEDIDMCRRIGAHGAPLIADGAGVLTHCNAGALATGDYGTALAVCYSAHESGREFTVYADETRPLLQGARLTTWELMRAGIRTVLICDNMAAALMRAGRVDIVVVGADRVAVNGDTANKIGTYGLAVLAKHHGIPFYVALPSSTIDATLPDGTTIPIEERHPDEVRSPAGTPASPATVEVWNPAFDVTPGALVAGFITERGILQAPLA
jgi:methylthioribose-1-phosphate isomerase